MSIISNIIDSDLRGFKVNDEIVVDKNVIGEFIKNSAKLTILNKNHQYDSLEKTYLNITNFGKWYVDNLNNNEESVEADLTLFDLSIKFDEDYEDTFSFPATLGEWANWIGNKVGVPLKGTFLNSDKQLTEKPYLGNNPKYRTAVKVIAKYASGWAEINEDETYSIKWFDDTTIHIEDWENFKHGSTTDPVNIIILSTGVTEDNIRYPEQIPTNAHELRIEDDWLAIDRYLISKSIFEQINGFSYTAITELTLPYGLLEFKVGQKIKTKDIELNEIESYISSHILTWDGGHWNDPNSWTSTLKMDELKETTTKYQYSNSIESRVGKTEINCDKNNKKINMLVEDVDDIEQDITTSKQAQGNPIEITDAGEYPLDSIAIEGKSYQAEEPTPTNPQEIKTVKGITNYLNTLGTNKADTTVSMNGVDYTFNKDGSISVKGTATGISYAFLLGDMLNDYSKERFLIDFDYIVSGWTNPNIRLVGRKTNGTYFNVFQGNTVSIKNVPLSLVYIQVVTGSTVDETIYPQLEKGTIAHRYVPHGRWLEQKTHGKNFLNWDGNFSVSNNNTFEQNIFCISSTILTKDLDDMILSGDFSLLDTSFMRVVYSNEYPKIGETYVRASNLTSTNNIIKINKDYKYVTIMALRISSSTFDMIKNSFQLEEGTKTTDYEEYKENIALIDMNIYDEEENITGHHEFSEIGDTKDTFKDGLLTKRIGKVVLDGSENIKKSSFNIVHGDRFFLNIPEASRTVNNVICTHFTTQDNEDFNINTIFIGGAANLPSLFINYSEYNTTTLNEFKSFLQEQYNAGTPVVIYYVLHESQTYELQYEKLKLFKGYNYITLNDDLYPNMNIKYLTDSSFNATYATHSELKIESDKITSEVSKKVSVDELDTVVEETNSKIEQTAESITNEVNGKFSNYSTTTEMNNAITQKVSASENSINLSVTQKINDIQIGGTNLLLGTEKPMSSGTSSGTNQTSQLYKFSDFFNTNYKSKIDTDEGLLVTCSFDWETTGTAGYFIVMLMGYPYTGLSKQIVVSANAKKGHSELTVTMKKSSNNSTNFSHVAIRRDYMTASVKISNMKIELGNKATDWSSAPEDKLDNSKFNKAEIVAEINNGVSNVKIHAENIQLANFVISGGKLTSLVTTKYNFTQNDITKVRDLIMEGSWTTAELNKYDINKNGKIDANDYISIKGIVDGNISTSKPGKFEINTNQDDYTHKGLIYGYNGDGVEKILIGLGESKLTNLNVKGTLTSSSDLNVAGSGTIIGGIGTNGQVFANGTVFSNALPVVNTHGIGNNSIKSIRMEYSPKSYLEILAEGGAYGIDAWASDKRLKRRVKDSKYDALDTLRKIKHRQFIYRNTDEKVLIGYVADELQELDPNMVFEVGPQKIKQPNPSIIIPILSKAIQEQQEIIDKQDKRIIELEDQVKKILELVERGPNGSN